MIPPDDGEDEAAESPGDSSPGATSSVARCLSGALVGIEPQRVDIEVITGPGLPGLRMVGLPSASVKESEERVKSAIRRSGFQWPRKKLTVNLAPADLPKAGSAFDLPIALAILAAAGGIDREELAGWTAVGELSLDGGLRPVRGALNYATLARAHGRRRLIVPEPNADEAALCEGVEVHGAENLAEAAAVLRGDGSRAVRKPEPRFREPELDFSEVKGQETARRAALIAAAGGHNLLLMGPPGSGKTMIARRLPSILPRLSFEDAIETLRIHSVAGLTLDGTLSHEPPFRAPHHTASAVGVIGGGNPLRPGEVSLAHNGILFLDELPEFRRDLLEALRQPLEDHVVQVTRARASALFPARFMLVAAMNPCPCGHAGSETACTCAAGEIQRYRSRVSGPLLDRIDIQVDVPRRPFAGRVDEAAGVPSADLRAMVMEARERQAARYGKARAKLNGAVAPRAFQKALNPLPAASALLEESVERLALSGRAAEKIQRIARTIADLAARESVGEEDIAEAVGYRQLDRRYR